MEEEEARSGSKGHLREKLAAAPWKKWFQRDNLLILILGGILLFIIALPVKDKTADGGDGENAALTGQEVLPWGTDESAQTQSSQGTGSSQNIGLTSLSTQDYAQYLEEKLEALISDMEGAGRVEVMITLEASEELIVEKDETVNRSNTNEEDSQGGKRILTQLETQGTTVYEEDGSTQTPYVVKTLLPKVEGVVVVAQGAGSGTLNRSIVEVIQALFDVEAHKIKVVKMGSQGSANGTGSNP